MGYVYTCDSCDTRHDEFPPFVGEFTETFLKTDGGAFAADYSPGQKVTICADCMAEVVL